MPLLVLHEDSGKPSTAKDTLAASAAKSKDSILQAGNPVKEILLKLNLPDHRILKDEGEGQLIERPKKAHRKPGLAYPFGEDDDGNSDPDGIEISFTGRRIKVGLVGRSRVGSESSRDLVSNQVKLVHSLVMAVPV
uniref:Uncharacterized protein n=1 Tax=Tanacetum cinerariifolium TaxID=118510 RepID=A0A6L2KFP5_TANCI|nr:hypothetical protein [Tanacetum cinerariifolium]